MTFWDIAAGILIAAFLIAGIAYGFRHRHERALGIATCIIAALLIIWRSSCWYWDLKCDAHLGSYPSHTVANDHQ
jgi:hypothetical protein